MGHQVQTIPVRHPRIDFQKGIERYYLRGNAVVSHFVSSVSILFPVGEQFFIDSVGKFKNRIHDPQLCSDIKAFCGQEFQHKNQHNLFTNLLENQDYKIKKVVRWNKWYMENVARSLPSSLQLSITVLLEHITATFSHSALENHMLDNADPTMRQLLVWHAIEEIEHKHVAFDVLETVHPKNYFLRLFGFLLAFPALLMFISLGLGALLKQDFQKGRLNYKSFKQHWLNMRKDKGAMRFLKDCMIFLGKYLKPGFHPRQINDRYLVDQYLSELRQFA